MDHKTVSSLYGDVKITAKRLFDERGRDENAIKDLTFKVLPTLDEAKYVLQGIRDRDAEGGFKNGKCFVGESGTGDKAGFVYCVYVMEDGIAHEWGWEPCEPKSDLPKGYRNGRFSKMIHPKNEVLA